jgi:tripeptidyl-peptidase I
MKSTLICLGAFLATALAAPAPRSHVLHERRDSLPKAFSDMRRLDGKTSLPMRIGLSQSNLHKGHDMLMEV